MLLLLSLAASAHAFIHSNTTVSGPTTQSAGFTYEFPDCVNGPLSNTTVCDTSKDALTRARALVALFTTTELIQNSVHEAEGVPRLGLPSYIWWSEASHGLSWTGPGVSFADSGDFSYASAFPQPINLGAAFDDPLVHAVATVISTEGTPWRDPRWGRGQETPGEDPFHTAQYVYQLVDGFQGGIDPHPHFAAYDMDDWGGVIQRQFNAIVTYSRAQRVLSPTLPVTILRDYWKFGEDRWVVSDCDAVQSIADEHHYVDTFPEAAAVALKAGTDINCGSIYFWYLQDAFDQGLAAREDLENALARGYASLVRLGYFDAPDKQPYRQLSWDDVGTPDSEKLAYTVAAEGMVLLKNDGTLPLNKKLKKLALVGPWGNATEEMQGNYYGTARFLISPFLGAQAAGYEVTFVTGTSTLGTSTDGFSDAVASAKAADVVVYVGGIDQSVEAEGLDRTSITWPGVQLDLIKALAAVGKPFIVVQFGAGQVDDTELKASKGINALIWGGYPGQSGGTALFDVITGKYPAGYVDQVPMTDMNLRPNKATGNPGRTVQVVHRHPRVRVRLRAALHDLQARRMRIWIWERFDTFGVQVQNTGRVASDFVVLMFVRTTNAGPAPYPNKELISYTRLHGVRAGGSATARLGVTLGSIARTDETGSQWVFPGEYTLSVDVPERLTHRFVLKGKAARITDFPQPPAAATKA
ncbi:glycoside hydrolase family 3 protein [Mycena rebaudengoi]|nr:glycoside hydrolase family 3 protein [Mycena rebaudengoi]